MEKYIHLFNTQAEFEAAYNGSEYKEPWLSYVEENNAPAFNKPDYTKTPFTIEALGGGSITWALNNKTVQYSKNGGSWETMTKDTTISVVEGDEIQFKGTNTSYQSNTISSTAQFSVKGNIMSLINDNNFETAKSLNTYMVFYELFNMCDCLISAVNLKLPATTLSNFCYTSMFNGCTNLTSAPELPSTTLSSACYESMFDGCTSLTTPPKLPSTTLADRCYSSMFRNCTSLSVAPELPSSTLADSCYSLMFNNCTSLTVPPELNATVLDDYCYQSMFEGCTNLASTPELPATTLKIFCYASMFKNCTKITTATELPAVTLNTRCYATMFNGCTNLTSAPELPATTLVSGCYMGMFTNCRKLNYVKALFTTTPSDTYTYSWLKGVSATGTFIKNASATWTNRGTNSIPTGWTVQTATS